MRTTCRRSPRATPTSSSAGPAGFPGTGCPGAPAIPRRRAGATHLITDWLRIIRQDPRLPLPHLPADWPAAPAQQLFFQLNARLAGPAAEAAAALLDTVAADQ
jgi:hypothetical protein